jgi:hypothetical protein
MPAKPPVQYTIRGVPADVDLALRRKAHRRRISLNRLLVEELIKSTGETRSNFTARLKVAGRWKEDAQFDRALEDQRKITEPLAVNLLLTGASPTPFVGSRRQ